MTIAAKIMSEFINLKDDTQAVHLSRFFKTGKGEYGEGDCFLGIKVPVTRSIVKKYKNDIQPADITPLIISEWHEIRLAGFLLLTELYIRAIKNRMPGEARNLVDYYIANIDKGNNWDLVDLVSSKLLGDWILRNPDDEYILFELADREMSLWHQRVAIVSTFTLICNEKYNITLKIAEKYLSHNHDLIHKATGWMLREIGKRGGMAELRAFLDSHHRDMPRTMLRYAIEKFPKEERKHYLTK